MEPVTASLMAIGSGSAAGLRPYFTVFALSLAGLAVPDDASSIVAKSVDQIPDSIANPWVLTICAILALAEFASGKFPAVDLVLEPISAWVRPLFGALVGMQLGVDSGSVTAAFTTLLGAGTSLPVSLGKTSATAATTVASGGAMDWLRSLFEDSSALILVVAAILLPILAAFLGLIAVGIGITLFIVFRRAYRAMRVKLSEISQWRERSRTLREAQLASGERVSTVQALKRLAAGATPAMAMGVTTSAGVMRTGATSATSWARSATSTATQVSSSHLRKASGATFSAFKATRTGRATPQASHSEPPNDSSVCRVSGQQDSPPGLPAPSKPAMPSQTTGDEPAYPSPTPGATAPESATQETMWSPSQNHPAPPPPQPSSAQHTGSRAQAVGERASQAVSSAKGQMGKLRGQFSSFRDGFAQSSTRPTEDDSKHE